MESYKKSLYFVDISDTINDLNSFEFELENNKNKNMYALLELKLQYLIEKSFKELSPDEYEKLLDHIFGNLKVFDISTPIVYPVHTEENKAKYLFPIKTEDLCIGEKFHFKDSSCIFIYMGIHTYCKQDYFIYKDTASIPFIKLLSEIKEQKIFKII